MIQRHFSLKGGDVIVLGLTPILIIMIHDTVYENTDIDVLSSFDHFWNKDWTQHMVASVEV